MTSFTKHDMREELAALCANAVSHNLAGDLVVQLMTQVAVVVMMVPKANRKRVADLVREGTDVVVELADRLADD